MLASDFTLWGNKNFPLLEGDSAHKIREKPRDRVDGIIYLSLGGSSSSVGVFFCELRFRTFGKMFLFTSRRSCGFKSSADTISSISSGTESQAAGIFKKQQRRVALARVWIGNQGLVSTAYAVKQNSALFPRIALIYQTYEGYWAHETKLLPRGISFFMLLPCDLKHRQEESHKLSNLFFPNNLYLIISQFKNAAAPLTWHIQDTSILNHIRHHSGRMSSRCVTDVLPLTPQERKKDTALKCLPRRLFWLFFLCAENTCTAFSLCLHCPFENQPHCS